MSFLENTHHEVKFIAEIGKNFIDTEAEATVAENLNKAIALVKAAKDSGADAVKFQTHVASDELLNEKFVSPHFSLMDRYSWVSRNEAATPVQEFWRPLKRYCDKIGIEFFSTPMSCNAARILNELDVKTWKIGSGDVTDLPLVKYMCDTEKPVIISTGMVGYDELNKIVDYFSLNNVTPTILYCVSEYPCPPDKFNLASINTLKKMFPNSSIGFSDHSIENTLSAVYACKLGARVIEKHFSFDRNAWGSDHKASLLPKEFSSLIAEVRALEKSDTFVPPEYMGEDEKELDGLRNQFRPIFRKGLIYSNDLKRGACISHDDISSIRPIMMLETDAIDYPRIVGRKLNRAVKRGDHVKLTDYD